MQALSLEMNNPVSSTVPPPTVSLSVDNLVGLSPGPLLSQASGETRYNRSMAHWRSSLGHWCMSTKMTKQFLR